MGPRDLQAYNFYDGKRISFEYESGIIVEGLNITGIRNIHGKLILIQFEDCTVTYKDQILFKPEYGTFDLAVGSSIVSAYAGSADFRSFDNLYHISDTKTVKATKNTNTIALEDLYQNVREMRINDSFTEEKGKAIFDLISTHHNYDWLLTLELYELAVKNNSTTLKTALLDRLNNLKKERTEITHLIDSGMSLLN